MAAKYTFIVVCANPCIPRCAVNNSKVLSCVGTGLCLMSLQKVV